MSLYEPTDENEFRIITDVKNNLVFLPNLIKAREIYEIDLSAPLRSEDFRKILPDLLLKYTTRGLEEDEVVIEGARYNVFFSGEGGVGSIDLSAPDGSNLPSIRVYPDHLASNIRKVQVSTPKIHISGNPPVTIQKLEQFEGNEMKKKFQSIYLSIPKGKITLGLEREGEYESLRVAIEDHTKEGLSVSLSMANQYTDSGTGYPSPVIRLYQLESDEFNAYGVNKEKVDENIVYVTYHNSSSFTAVEAGTSQYEVSSSIAVALAQQITGRKIKDVTPNELAEDLFKGKVKTDE